MVKSRSFFCLQSHPKHLNYVVIEGPRNAWGLGANSPRASVWHTHHLRNHPASISSHPDMQNHLLCDTLGTFFFSFFFPGSAVCITPELILSEMRLLLSRTNRGGGCSAAPPTQMSVTFRSPEVDWCSPGLCKKKRKKKKLAPSVSLLLSCSFSPADERERNSASYFQRGVALALVCKISYHSSNKSTWQSGRNVVHFRSFAIQIRLFRPIFMSFSKD